MIARVQQGRAQTVILTCRTPTGGTSTITTTAVWRVMGDFDPTLEGATNSLTHLGAEPDINAIFDAAQITLAQLRSVLYATLGQDATGAQPAERYVLLDVEPIGMLPGGDRFFTKWSRQH
jgi:hypothetical protein